jgi:1-acyl-sn-glycerol-3-phosphate acyltransferase
MIYRLLRWISGIAIHWFYRDIRVTNRSAIPDRGPLLIAVNHQNALVDSLMIGWIVERHVTMTAKATLINNPLVALLFRTLHVVPLRRASDELPRADINVPDRSRNSEAFSAILDVLETDGAVLIFPEGKSHNESKLEPLKTGLARLALEARDDRRISGVRILPIGLVFEDKGAPGSVAAVNVGDAVEMDSWSGSDPSDLTTEVTNRLKSVSEWCEIPDRDDSRLESDKGALTSLFIRIAAGWGRLTHELPIRLARRIALRQSRDPDQPAMRTIVLGTGLVLLTYAASFALIDAIVHSFWLSALAVTSLGVGAYWAAFEGHARKR